MPTTNSATCGTWNTIKWADGHTPSHGFQVSIGLLAATAYYEQFLHSDIAPPRHRRAVAAWPELAEAEKYALELYAGTDFPEIG